MPGIEKHVPYTPSAWMMPWMMPWRSVNLMRCLRKRHCEWYGNKHCALRFDPRLPWLRLPIVSWNMRRKILRFPAEAVLGRELESGCARHMFTARRGISASKRSECSSSTPCLRSANASHCSQPSASCRQKHVSPNIRCNMPCPRAQEVSRASCDESRSPMTMVTKQDGPHNASCQHTTCRAMRRRSALHNLAGCP